MEHREYIILINFESSNDKELCTPTIIKPDMIYIIDQSTGFFKVNHCVKCGL